MFSVFKRLIKRKRIKDGLSIMVQEPDLMNLSDRIIFSNVRDKIYPEFINQKLVNTLHEYIRETENQIATISDTGSDKSGNIIRFNISKLRCYIAALNRHCSDPIKYHASMFYYDGDSLKAPWDFPIAESLRDRYSRDLLLRDASICTKKH